MDFLTSESDVVVVLQAVNSIKLTTNVEFLSAVVQELHSWVVNITTENLLSLLGPTAILSEGEPHFQDLLNLLVWSVNIVNGDDGKVAVVTEVTEGDSGTSLDTKLLNGLLGDVKSNWHGEKVAIGKTVVGDDTKSE